MPCLCCLCLVPVNLPNPSHLLLSFSQEQELNCSRRSAWHLLQELTKRFSRSREASSQLCGLGETREAATIFRVQHARTRRQSAARSRELKHHLEGGLGQLRYRFSCLWIGGKFGNGHSLRCSAPLVATGTGTSQCRSWHGPWPGSASRSRSES